MVLKRKSLILLVLSALATSLLHAAERMDDVRVGPDCVQLLKSEKDGLLVKIFKEKVPALFSTYTGISAKRQQIKEKIAKLQQNCQALHNEAAKQIIEQKIVSLQGYDQKLEESVATLEERAYELILIKYALQVAPESIDDDTHSNLDREIQEELKFAEAVMKQVDNIDK